MKPFIVVLLSLLVTVTVYSQIKSTIKIYNMNGDPIAKVIESNVSDLLNEINIACSDKRSLDLTKIKITEEAKTALTELWTRTKGFDCNKKIIGTDIIQREYDKKYEIRGIPFHVKGDDENGQQEEGIVVLNVDGTINDVLFGLDTEKYSTFTEGKNITDIRRRQIILNFVETFRTAYNRKDIKYIEDVFSENALIIVGKVIKQSNNASLLNQLEEKKVELIRQTKKEYISGLQKVFSGNKYIKVLFDSVSIVQHRKYDYIYAVTLVQQWNSTGYSDIGYVFLLINFIDEQYPLILVRSWQDKTLTTDDEVIRMSDFRIE